MTAAPTLTAIPITAIRESQDNPRKHFDPAFVSQVAASMRVVGQLTPATVRPHPAKPGYYELAAGATRLRAAREAGKPTLLCLVHDYDDAAFLEVLTFENLQRRDLRPLEEARGYALLMKRLEGYTVERIAEKSGVSPSYVRDRLRLLSLTEAAAGLLDAGTMDIGHALELAKLSPTMQERAIAEGLFARVLGAFFDDDEAEDTVRHAQRTVTVAELRAWIARSVVLDPSAALTQELFPDAVTVATGQAVPVLVSREWQVPKAKKGEPKVLARPDWREVGAKRCPHAVAGFVAIGTGRGQAVTVCSAKTACVIHWKQEVKAAKARAAAPAKDAKDQAARAAAAAAEAAQRAKEEAERKRWVDAAPALLAAIVQKSKGIKPSHPRVRALVKAGRAPKEVEKAIKALGAPKTADDVLRVLVLLDVAEVFWDQWSMTHELPAVCKEFGVDAKALLAASAKATTKTPTTARAAR